MGLGSYGEFRRPRRCFEDLGDSAVSVVAVVRATKRGAAGGTGEELRTRLGDPAVPGHLERPRLEVFY